MIVDENHTSSAHNILCTTKVGILYLISVERIVTLHPADCRYTSNNLLYKQISSKMKIAKEKVKFHTPWVNPIIDLERTFENILKKGEYIVRNAEIGASFQQ